MSDAAIVEVSIDQVRPLLEENELPTVDLEPGAVKLFAICDDETVIGCIGVERYGPQALIRSLAVDSDHRRSGIGATLIETALEHAKANAATEAFGITTDAADYLERFGFEPVDRQAVVGPITRSTQLHGACPDTAVVMRRRL